jgi:hypothetical protein
MKRGIWLDALFLVHFFLIMSVNWKFPRTWVEETPPGKPALADILVSEGILVLEALLGIVAVGAFCMRASVAFGFDLGGIGRHRFVQLFSAFL